MAKRKTTKNDRSGVAKVAAKVVPKKAVAAKPPVAAKPAVAPPTRVDRGPVDAPGKRHRKPPPQESINKRMGEPTGKQMGQKNFKHGMQRGRG